MPTEKGARRQCSTVGSPRLRVAPRLRLGGTRRRVHEGASPLKLPQGSGVVGRHPPPARGSQKAPRRRIPKSTILEQCKMLVCAHKPFSRRRCKIWVPLHGTPTSSQTRARKGSMEQSVHRPLSQSGLPIVRRVNSAAGERVGLDPLRRPRRPVVTACYIDPPTRTERTSFALRLRLRRRSRAAARPSACADTRAPSVVNASRAC